MSEELFDVYVDSVRIGVGAYGFLLKMGVLDAGEEEKPIVLPLGQVRMSPQHAYVLAKLLQKNVDNYEKTIGKIDLPDKMLKGLDIE